jgi:hypothetical protein
MAARRRESAPQADGRGRRRDRALITVNGSERERLRVARDEDRQQTGGDESERVRNGPRIR